jgi:DNA repair exonuclease SbcCD ATPase subunit
MASQNEKLPFNNYTSLTNAGLGKAVFEFFDQKQQQAKSVGFRNLLDDRKASKSHNFRKKPARPGHDLEIQKLLEENKRLHSRIEKKSREEVELSEFEKKVLKDEKDMCMKRIEELEEEVEELSRNNYKLQEIEKEKERKAGDTIADVSLGTFKN